MGNLIENAVDHASDKVEIKVHWDDSTVWITINDDGSGFDGDISAKIGEPFVTSGGEGTTGKGLGLGLFIAKTLLERSGAKLSFSNSPPGGLSGACALVEWPRDLIEVSKSFPKAAKSMG